MSYYLLDYNPGTPQYTFPRRGGAKLSGTVIMHTAECLADNFGEDTSAEGCASMIANRADWGSYHCLCDSDSRIDMAPWEYEVWGDTETNNWAVHISAALRTVDWLTMPADRRERVYRNLASCAADFVIYMRDTYGVHVPLRRISGAEARARVPGFCAHGDSGIARSDPGRDFDWGLFFAYTQAAINNGGISPQGTITSEEDELSEAAVLDIARIREILEAGERDNTRARIASIDQRTALLVKDISYVKSADSPTLYERNEEDNTLRGISLTEWELTGKPYVTYPAAKFNELFKTKG